MAPAGYGEVLSIAVVTKRASDVTPAARIAAAAEVLDRIADGQPAEKALVGWTRGHRFAGSKDRAALRDLVFDALRRKGSYASFGGGTSGRALMIGSLRSADTDPQTVFTGEGYAPSPLTNIEQTTGERPTPGSPVALDCPDWLWPLMQTAHGSDSSAIMTALQSRAPVHLRVNLGKTDVASAIARLSTENIETRQHPLASTALEIVEGARRVRGSDSFSEGWVELQDAASQALAENVPLRNGQRMLDFCAGGGGKSLAVAARVAGRFWAHDATPRRMSDLPARSRRAGVVIERVGTAALPEMAPFDTVLADVPCSGSGSWRRDPEGKWALTESRLETLCAQQDAILRSASRLVRRGGQLVYGTCSLIGLENQDRIDRFVAEHEADWSLVSQRQLTPLDGADGFFWAVLRKL